MYCNDCPLLTYIPNIKGLQILNCSNCSLLTNIPNIEGLEVIYCNDCVLLTNIPNIQGLKDIFCNECPLLTSIPYIEYLETLECCDCPLLTNIPNIEYLECNNNLNKPFENCKYLTSKKMDKLYNNIFYLWKCYKLKQYALYLEKEIYSNPRLPYMQYYIENNLYEEKNNGGLKIGYITNKKNLIFYKIKK